MKKKSNAQQVVLFVDDDKNIQFIGKFALTKIGYSVLLAENCEQALKLFIAHMESISCVILDLNMPLMNGYECLEKMKELNPGVKVVLSTGYEFAELPEKLKTEPFLKKPYTIDAIRKLVIELTEN